VSKHRPFAERFRKDDPESVATTHAHNNARILGFSRSADDFEEKSHEDGFGALEEVNLVTVSSAG
jgi:hypothetical protein